VPPIVTEPLLEDAHLCCQRDQGCYAGDDERPVAQRLEAVAALRHVYPVAGPYAQLVERASLNDGFAHSLSRPDLLVPALDGYPIELRRGQGTAGNHEGISHEHVGRYRVEAGTDNRPDDLEPH